MRDGLEGGGRRRGGCGPVGLWGRRWAQVELAEWLGFSCHLVAPLGKAASQLSPRVWVAVGRGWAKIFLNTVSAVLFCCPHLMPCPLGDPGP